MNLRGYRVFAALCVIGMMLGCGRSPEVTAEKPPQAVYVDTKTMEAVVSERVDDPPARNPKTGQRTLVPALYCPACQRWHPVPPPDQINRVPAATKCPKTGAALTVDGPWPD